MKKILLLIMVAGFVACSTLTPSEKAERAAKQAAYVANALNDRHFQTIFISFILISKMGIRWLAMLFLLE